MNDEILPIPRIPEGLREAAQLGKLIPFIGAGVSRIAGCPSWAEFADAALEQLVERAKLSYAHLEQIRYLTPRIKLSLAGILQREHKIQLDYRQLLQTTNWQSNTAGQKLYKNLSRLGKTFITTNYDEWLDREPDLPSLATPDEQSSVAVEAAVQRNSFHNLRDLTIANLNKPNAVFHLHGSVVEPDQMVLTTKDYIRHYASDRPPQENPVRTFLEHLFAQKTVLFVGYGLEELEILEYVISKSQPVSRTDPSEPRHYLLQGFFSHELELMRSLRGYYLHECGIQLLPFRRDEKDWIQLLEVLAEFARTMPASEPMVLQKYREMDALLNE